MIPTKTLRERMTEALEQHLAALGICVAIISTSALALAGPHNSGSMGGDANDRGGAISHDNDNGSVWTRALDYALQNFTISGRWDQNNPRANWADLNLSTKQWNEKYPGTKMTKKEHAQVRAKAKAKAERAGRDQSKHQDQSERRP